jgi:hypothetical protein
MWQYKANNYPDERAKYDFEPKREGRTAIIRLNFKSASIAAWLAVSFPRMEPVRGRVLPVYNVHIAGIQSSILRQYYGLLEVHI